MKKDGIDERTRTQGGWTSIDNYFVALARRRTARHKREGRPVGRMDEDGPQPTIGTIPFIAMMVAFAFLVAAIASLAWPVHDAPKPRQAAKELGTAPPGWLEEAEREMKQAK